MYALNIIVTQLIVIQISCLRIGHKRKTLKHEYFLLKSISVTASVYY